ncbi:MAG: hypothetical protein HRT77_01045 [Halioglobus sp.]|nr:hypothetical protein [Halioglobus sp.]
MQLFERILVAVPDMRAAVAQYQVLFAAEGVQSALSDRRRVTRWALPNTVIELVEGSVLAPHIQGIAFSFPAAGPQEMPVENTLGLDIRASDGRSTADFRDAYPEAQATTLSVDHLVLRTQDADSCIGLFRDRLGVRLALDQTVPQWGGRMLFFRGGKLTLEVITSEAAGGFWGIAYRCAEIDVAAARLLEAGVSLSAVRDGRKPGTRVATIQSHCLEIPTLLIQQAAT